MDIGPFYLWIIGSQVAQLMETLSLLPLMAVYGLAQNEFLLNLDPRRHSHEQGPQYNSC